MDALVEVLVSRQDRSLPIVELDVSRNFGDFRCPKCLEISVTLYTSFSSSLQNMKETYPNDHLPFCMPFFSHLLE
jgi:hypothetical protein